MLLCRCLVFHCYGFLFSLGRLSGNHLFVFVLNEYIDSLQCSAQLWRDSNCIIFFLKLTPSWLWLCLECILVLEVSLGVPCVAMDFPLKSCGLGREAALVF